MADKKKRVFLSSTRMDLQWYRDKVREICDAYGIEIYGQEDFTDDGSLRDANMYSEASMRDNCTSCICIVAYRYGYSVDGERSVTQAEYDYARKLFSNGIYDGVYVLLCESLENFDESDDIKKYATKESENPEDYHKQKDFRDQLDNSVLTLFDRKIKFEINFIKLVETRIAPKKLLSDDILLKSYKRLTRSERALRDNSKEAINALACLQSKKELHFITHKFRHQVISDIISSIPTPQTFYNSSENRSEAGSSAVSSYKSSFIRNIQRQEEELKRYIFLAEPLEKEIVAISKVKSCSFMFHENSEIADVVSQLRLLLKNLDDILRDTEKDVSRYSNEFYSPASETLNYLQKSIVVNGENIYSKRERDRWNSELERIRTDRDQLKRAVNIHALWQKRHKELCWVDSRCDNIEQYLFVKDTETIDAILVDKFTKDLEQRFFNGGVDKFQEIIEELYPPDELDRQASILGLESDIDFDDALEELVYVFKELKKSEYKYKQASGSPAHVCVEKYRKFRKVFNEEFYKVGHTLNDIVQRESQWIEPLYTFLNEVHQEIQACEGAKKSSDSPEQVNEY